MWLFSTFLAWLCVVCRTRTSWWMLWSMPPTCWVSWGPPCFLQRATTSSVSFCSCVICVGNFTKIDTRLCNNIIWLCCFDIFMLDCNISHEIISFCQQWVQQICPSFLWITESFPVDPFGPTWIVAPLSRKTVHVKQSPERYEPKNLVSQFLFWLPQIQWTTWLSLKEKSADVGNLKQLQELWFCAAVGSSGQKW